MSQLTILVMVLVMSLPVGMPSVAAEKESPAASQRVVVEDTGSDADDQKETREATREETKRKNNLGKMLFLWFLRNHPLQ
jgi:hypothetical protein